MIIGVAKEIKNNENRVALTPAGTEILKRAGHTVLIEQGAGLGSGFSDESYIKAGAQTIADKKALFDQADMIIKVKEPLAPEYDLFHAGQILFTYLHLAPEPELTKALLAKKVIGIAYETIERNHTLPLLTPMSEVAGRMAVQVGAHCLEKPFGGKGILLGGVPGVESAQVVIVGGGTVGTNAAKMAVGMGARVAVLDKSVERLVYLDDIFGGKVTTVMSNSYNIAHWVKNADLLVGAVLLPGAKAPKLVTEEMVKSMEPGSVIVDVAIDQGGSVETIDRVTTHSDPTYVKYGVVHYSVANMPGAVARTSTIALTNATIDYALQIANKGWQGALRADSGLAKGLNVYDGKITFKGVAEAHRLPCTPVEEILG
ncbi:alanine dehydrogenase [Sporomusa acidovorans]|uniref:Alanine dehydrogenase n=1 Tax=Sporomusa acidovorans (strain ATCC 49682 / DSM 3132 / Mol) TaxID=1123286 RepID=A0ABZ3IVZ6_SPOA4|nr:alanine dehydrogenase [Sporomusa acidovorans]OZC15242.1 alanine dehydrogenase [Sporomusa acidovorans DSM 3132]SDE90946.1 alanine dehydrogenase [Sporomusa acidovorans]